MQATHSESQTATSLLSELKWQRAAAAHEGNDLSNYKPAGRAEPPPFQAPNFHPEQKVAETLVYGQ